MAEAAGKSGTDRILRIGAGASYAIDVPQDQRHRLLNGLDAIAETLLDETFIRAHEDAAPIWITPQPA